MLVYVVSQDEVAALRELFDTLSNSLHHVRPTARSLKGSGASYWLHKAIQFRIFAASHQGPLTALEQPPARGICTYLTPILFVVVQGPTTVQLKPAQTSLQYDTLCFQKLARL